MLHRVRDPYAALLREQLHAAGIPHHVRSIRTLAQSVAGRVLLGALTLPDTGYRRTEIVSWWRSGPVLDLAGMRARVPVARYDRIAREAGVICGLDQWRQRLDRAAERRREHLASRPPPPEPEEGAPPVAERAETRLPQIEALVAAVEALAERLGSTARPLVGRVGAVGVRAPRRSPRRHGRVERRGARSPGRRRAGGRAGSPASTASTSRPTCAASAMPSSGSSRRPARSQARFGHGVAVGPLFDAVGADLDLVVVVGARRGHVPAPRHRRRPRARP